MAVLLSAGRSGLCAGLCDLDATGADDPVEQLVEIGGELLGRVSGPDVQGLGRALGLLQRRALGQLRREDERAEHVAQLLDAELVLDRLRSDAVDDDAERLQTRGEASADLLDRAKRAVGRGNGEQARFGHDHDAVAGRPRGAREGIE